MTIPTPWFTVTFDELEMFVHLSQTRIKISDLTDISILEFYGYIEYIGEYFYINIGNMEISKNTLKFLEIPYKSLKMR